MSCYDDHFKCTTSGWIWRSINSLDENENETARVLGCRSRLARFTPLRRSVLALWATSDWLVLTRCWAGPGVASSGMSELQFRNSRAFGAIPGKLYSFEKFR